MLTRIKFRRDFRLLSRCLSDKPSDADGKIPDMKTDSKFSSDDNLKKIQELIKNMSKETTISESEYRARFTTAPEKPKRPKQQNYIDTKMVKIEENITRAAGEVAQALGGDVKQTEAELLSKVLGKINQTSTNLSDLLIGMKVDRSKDSEDKQPETRGQQVKRIISKARDTQGARAAERRTMPIERERKSVQQAVTVNLFGSQPLGIFKAREPNYGTKLDAWDDLKERELTLATMQPPGNYFQKMILWTEQGKVWKFPINNEQGLEQEQNVSFSEHIFLDAHLEGWCPKKGPIRHFMELVCVGLSKNAFYTAKEKKDHIMWYKEYFESKKDLLTEVGAWDNVKKNVEVTT